MHIVRLFKSISRVRADNPDLLRAQVRALSVTIPLMYLVLVTNTAILAATHFGNTPILLSAVVPSLIILFSLQRLVAWRAETRKFANVDPHRLIQRTLRLGAALALLVVVWGMSLYRFGGDFAKEHVIFYLTLTSMSSLFTMMHLKPAAVALPLVIIILATVLLMFNERPAFIGMALTALVVGAATTVVMLINFRDFAHLAEATRRLKVKQRETKALSDANFRLANIDTLTGLPNRRRFFSELEARVRQAVARGQSISVGLVDLDGFKPVNDLYGHQVGDRVLAEVAQRLMDVAQGQVFHARLGGDEFACIISGASDTDQVEALGRAICTALSAPFRMDHLSVQLSGSVGLTSARSNGLDPAHLLEQADIALYAAKQQAPGGVALFSNELQHQVRYNVLVEQALKGEDFLGQLSLNFQPIFDFRAGRTVGFEALARWNSPELGQVPPDVFIKAAERTGRIGALTETLLGRALAETRGWPNDLRLSFNLSMMDVAKPDAVQRIASIVRQSGVHPHRLDFEITETALMLDFEETCRSLMTLRALGAQIALDDFGAGYSSLSSVHKLPIDKIKVDRGFIAELETERASRNIVKSVIDLCRNLGVACVVEGVETAGQIRILGELGVHQMQGYFISRPVPAPSVSSFVARERGAANPPDSISA
jgi:diguanylate cyclase (GGDEF)-like protein